MEGIRNVRDKKYNKGSKLNPLVFAKLFQESRKVQFVFLVVTIWYLDGHWQSGRPSLPNNETLDNFAAFALPGSAAAGPQCVLTTSQTRRCYQPRLIPYMNASLPLIVGIGPPKTSTTAVFHHLNQSDEVVSADARVNNEACCFMEVFYFTSKFDDTASVDAYGAKYFRLGRPAAKWLAEKSTDYGNDLLAPYRMRALVAQVFLIYTIRQPLEAHLSYYFFFNSEKMMAETGGGALSAAHFLNYSRTAVAAYQNLTRCQHDTASRFFKGGEVPAPLVVNGVSVPAWTGVQHIDEAAAAACMRGSDNQKFPLHASISNYVYSSRFIRWSRVFPNAPLACVTQEEMLTDPKTTMLRIAKALKLDDLWYFERELEWFEFAHGSLVPPLERLQKLTAGADAKTKAAVAAHLSMLENTLFRGEAEFAHRFCKSYDVSLL